MKIRTPLVILAGLAGAMALSAYWQFGNARQQFLNFAPEIPPVETQLLMPGLEILKKNDAYSEFISPDGNLSFEYPASFQASAGALGKNPNNPDEADVLFFAYRINIPDLQPAYIIATKNNATSSEAIKNQVKQGFIDQKCQAEMTSATSTGQTLETVNTAYECPAAPKGMERWQSQTKIAPTENGAYVLTAISTAQSWLAFLPEAQKILSSARVKNIFPGATTTDATTTDETGQADNLKL